MSAPRLNEGKGTVGKLYKDEEIYNRANALVAKFDATTARLDRVIAKVESGEGTVGKLLYDEQLQTPRAMPSPPSKASPTASNAAKAPPG